MTIESSTITPIASAIPVNDIMFEEKPKAFSRMKADATDRNLNENNNCTSPVKQKIYQWFKILILPLTFLH